jgi:hypothetical protein
MKKWYRTISILVVVFMLFLNVMSVSAQTTDYSKNWASKEIDKWLSLNIAQANDKGEFKPSESIKRIDMAILLNRLFNYQDKSNSAFSDINKNTAIADEVAKAVAAGNFNGNNGKFRPNDPITRQEAAAVFARAFNLAANSGNTLTKFKDAGKIASWSKDSINAIVAKGYMKGIPSGLFAPDSSITRAEAVKIVDNIVEDLKNKADTYTGEVNGNLVVNVKDVILKDMTIKGDLYLTEGIGSGNVKLDNVKVAGRTIVQGGGENSIILNNASLAGTLIVIKKDGKVRIVATGSSNVGNVDLKSGAKLEESNLTGPGFKNVEVIAMTSGQQVTLDGDFDLLDIAVNGVSAVITDGIVTNVKIKEGTSGSKLSVGSTGTVTNFIANGAVSVTGGSRIKNADINVNGVIIDAKPENVDVAQGITATIAGGSVTYTTPSASVVPPGTGGNGGSNGGGGDSTPSIALTAANRKAYVGYTTATRVKANPASAVLSYSSGNTSVATVNAASGAITGISAGTAVITVTAQQSGYISAASTFTVNVLQPGPISDFARYDYNNTTAVFEFSEPVDSESVKIMCTTTDAGLDYLVTTTAGVNWVNCDLNASITESSVTAGAINLLPNTHYSFKLVVTGGGLEGDSNIVSLTTDGNVQNFTAIDWNNSTASFTFAGPGTTDAAVQYSTDNGNTFNNATLDASITAITTSASISGLTSNTEYIFRLYVSSGANAGGSNWVRLTTESNIQDFMGYSWTNNTAAFKFTPVGSGTTSVGIQYSIDGGSTFSDATLVAPITTTTTNASISGLQANTDYTFRMLANGGANAGYSNSTDLTTEGNLQDFQGYSWTNNTVMFKFSPLGTGTTSAKIIYTTDGGIHTSDATLIAPITTTTTNASISGLQANTRYLFAMVVTGGANAGESNAAGLTTESNLQDFDVIRHTNTTAEITFSAVGDDATSAVIQYTDDAGDTWNYAANTITSTTTNAAISGLKSDTLYIFRMKVVGGVNAGYSNWDSAWTNGNIQDFSIISGSNNKVEFEFSPLGAEVTYASIHYYDGSKWSIYELPSVTSTTTTASITGLKADTRYVFYLFVIGGNNTGESNSVVGRTQSNLQDFKSKDISYTSASFTFTAPVGATRVKIIQSTDNGNTWSDSTTAGLNAGSTSATVTNLTPNTLYSFKLYVEGGYYDGHSNNSNIYTGTSLPSGSPANPKLEQLSPSDPDSEALLKSSYENR